ncbi:MAG TPA: zf-HC2 domain-containing protein [Gemmatimonadaceae bacterium]|nr:zf-HC2 domain-containing protein [Gemmatimonadaceae bacterium]
MQHPDEGTIHAWLDGALGAEDARAFEAHVAECAQCAAAVTEARGLLAASSRILSALDSVPGGVLPTAEPEGARDERITPIGRSSLWRSPGLRAAAAIVLVGSVSWLATRSVGKQAEVTVASPSEVSSATSYDTASPSSARVQADSVALAGERAAPPNAPSTAQAAPRREARVDAQRSMASGATASADEPVAPRAPAPQVVAAPQVIPYAMPRLAESPNAGAIAGAGGRATMTAGSAAPAAQATPPVADASAELREERRAADAGLRVRGAAKASPRMKASAPAAARGALMRTDESRALDAEVQRLAGCYYIENAASQSSVAAIRSAAGLVPAQVELLPDTDASAGGSWRFLRPAPGAPPFQLSARASWLVLSADSVKLELGEGTQSVTARIGVTGDSIHGYATVTDPLLPAGAMGTDVRGSRMLCSTP